MTEEQIKHMVDRFLGWKLPRDTFNPDCGISFDKEPFNTHTPYPSQHEPSGTNLFDATQAKAMVRYMLEGLPRPNASDCDKQGGSLIDKNCEPVFTSAKATGWTGQKCPHCKGTGENLSNPMNSGACNKCGGTGDEYVALSAHPHASDCKRVTAPVDVRETAEVSASVHSVDETSQSEGSGRGLITPSSGGSSPPQEATHASDCDKQGER